MDRRGAITDRRGGDPGLLSEFVTPKKDDTDRTSGNQVAGLLIEFMAPKTRISGNQVAGLLPGRSDWRVRPPPACGRRSCGDSEG
jgi:hypothetical protein